MFGPHEERKDVAQTLSRGLTILEMIATSPTGLSTIEITRRMGLPRTNVYRLINTLCAHGLVEGSSKCWKRAQRLDELLASPSPAHAHEHILKQAATHLGATVYLGVLASRSSVRVCAVAPDKGSPIPLNAHVSLQVGATGCAVLASALHTLPHSTVNALAGSAWDNVTAAFERGWAACTDQWPTWRSVAVPLPATAGTPGAVVAISHTITASDDVVTTLTQAANTLTID